MNIRTAEGGGGGGGGEKRKETGSLYYLIAKEVRGKWKNDVYRRGNVSFIAARK